MSFPQLIHSFIRFLHNVINKLQPLENPDFYSNYPLKIRICKGSWSVDNLFYKNGCPFHQKTHIFFILFLLLSFSFLWNAYWDHTVFPLLTKSRKMIHCFPHFLHTVSQKAEISPVVPSVDNFYNFQIFL